MILWNNTINLIHNNISSAGRKIIQFIYKLIITSIVIKSARAWFKYTCLIIDKLQWFTQYLFMSLEAVWKVSLV